MWGSSFADFAKKAEELQAQASLAATQAATQLQATQPSGLFSLDALQQEEETGTNKVAANSSSHDRTVTSGPVSHTAPLPTVDMSSSSKSAVPVAVPVARPPAPQGRLKLPSSSSSPPPPPAAKDVTSVIPQPTTTDAQTPTTTQAEDPSSTNKATDDGENDDVHVDVGAAAEPGWADEEDDLDLSDTENSMSAAAAVVDTDAREEEIKANEEAKRTNAVVAAVAADLDPSVATPNQQLLSSPMVPPQTVLSVEADESSSSPAVVPENEDGSSPGTNQIEEVPSKEPQQAIEEEEEEESVETTDPVPTGTPKAKSIPLSQEDNVPVTPAPIPSELAPSQLAMPFSPPSPSPPRSKLLILLSSESIDRQVTVRQDLASTALTAAGVDFETVDGVHHKELRNELFELSGRRGDYPQFFLVNVADGGTTFWGAFERFQESNDARTLVEDFGGSRALIDDETATATTMDITTDATTTTNDGRTAGDPAAIPEHVLENFSQQIKRIEENYQSEREATELRHAQALADAGNQQASCDAARLEVEQRLTASLASKDEQLQELCRRNEGYRLKLDMLKREVSGTQDLLAERDGDVGKANEKYLHDLRAMEKKMVKAENSAESFEKQVKTLQESLDSAQGELGASKEQHEELKERVKSVASELKDRRVECRDLRKQIDEIMEQNQALQCTVDSLQERLNHQGMSQTEKAGEMQQLEAKLGNAAQEMVDAKKEFAQAQTKSDQALQDYKKKAQHMLSMANSRTAAAVQAREEAELDARAARTTADSAFDRATKAEIASREAVSAAKATVASVENERDAIAHDCTIAKEALEANEKKLSKVQSQLSDAESSRDAKAGELGKVRADLDTARANSILLEQKYTQSQEQVSALQNQITLLQDQLQRAKAATVASAETEEARPDTSTTVNNGQGNDIDPNLASVLQEELLEANEAIEDLKEALRKAVELNEGDGKPGKATPATTSVDDSESNDGDDYGANGQRNGGSQDSIPLFYAMEKQAELKTARDEMNRLASVLANVQTEKSEAVEAMEDMRRRMEDAEARLKRFEKLGSRGGNGGTASSTMSTENGYRNGTADADSGAVNIEYLKHIMLRFLNAKAVAERKALVPVIGAVLELTPDELDAAVKNIEQSGSATSSLFGFMS